MDKQVEAEIELATDTIYKSKWFFSNNREHAEKLAHQVLFGGKLAVLKGVEIPSKNSVVWANNKWRQVIPLKEAENEH